MIRSLMAPLCRALGALAVGAALAAPAVAADPVRLVVAFPPGGPADTLARILSKELEQALGGTLIVENKPGGNGAVAINQVRRGPADGSVMFLSTAGAVVINPALYPKLAYDPAKDLVPVGLVVHTPEVLVTAPGTGLTSASAYLEAARASKEPPALASSGIGSMPHMAIELLRQRTGVDFLHVAYKGAAPAIADTMGGHVQAFIGDVSGLMPFLGDGQLVALGVAAPQRLPALPDVPTLAEQGIEGVEASNWYGLFLPSGASPELIERTNAALQTALASESVRKSLAGLGVAPAPGSAAEFAALIEADTGKWAEVIRTGNVQPE